MQTVLPTPTLEFVNTECDEFDQESRLVEGALGQLWKQFPRNTETPHVLLKVLVLNKLYSTRVNDNDVDPLARHITGLAIDKHLDQLLDQGSLDAVFLITDCPNLKQYLSFASKFCSWHNPTAYPIYDGDVRECLWSYQKQDPFAEFQNKGDLYYYRKLVDTVIAFRNHYGLNSLSFKQLDKFMWRAGDRILRERTDRKNTLVATSGSE
jgi:hypothetical protein